MIAVSRWRLFAEEYETSEVFERDAVEWLADVAVIPDDVMAGICALYRDSPRFATVVGDALAGECSWR